MVSPGTVRVFHVTNKIGDLVAAATRARPIGKPRNGHDFLGFNNGCDRLVWPEGDAEW